MANVRSNFLWNASYQVLRIAIPLVTVPYLTRVLSSGYLGIYSYTYTVANYFTLFCLLGVNQYGSRECAKAAQHGGDVLSRTFWSILFMQLACGLVVTCVYVGYLLTTTGIVRICTAIWLMWVIAESFDVAWLFFGLEEFRVTTIRNALVKLATVVCILTLVNSDADLWKYCAITSASMLVSAVVLLPMIKAKVSWYLPSVSEVTKHFGPNLRLFAPIVAISCYMQLDKVMLGAMAGMNELAYYDNSEKISTIPLAVIQALGTVMLPRMSVYVERGNEEGVARSISKALLFSNMMGWGFCFGIIGVAKEFVPLFFGAGYESCIILIRIMAPIIPIVAWSNVLGVQYLLPHELDGDYLVSVVSGAALNVIVNSLAIPSYGAVGASIATVMAEIAVTGTQLWMVHRSLSIKRLLMQCVPFFIAGIVMCAAVMAFGEVLHGSVIYLFAQVLIGVVVFCLVLAGLLALFDRSLLSEIAGIVGRDKDNGIE